MDNFEHNTVAHFNLNHQPETSNANDKEHKMLLFVGDKYTKYYKEKFDQITPQKQISGFNIAAFFLGVMWLFYRKMYAYGFIAIAVIIVIGTIEELLNLSTSGASIGLAVAFGMLGNTLYKQFVEKKISQVKSDEELEKEGGTNIWAALTVLVLAVVFISLGYFFEN